MPDTCGTEGVEDAELSPSGLGETVQRESACKMKVRAQAANFLREKPEYYPPVIQAQGTLPPILETLLAYLLMVYHENIYKAQGCCRDGGHPAQGHHRGLCSAGSGKMRCSLVSKSLQADRTA